MLIMQHKLGIGAPADISSYSQQQSTSISEVSNPLSSFMNYDGTKYFVGAFSSGTIYEYSVGTPYDLATLSYVGVTTLTGTTFPAACDIGFSQDGTKCYVATAPNGRTEAIIRQFVLSIAWDLSSATFDDSLDITAQSSDYYGIVMSNDGTRMFTIDQASDTIHSYTLSSAWDITTALYDSKSFSTSGQASNSRDLAMSANGAHIFIANDTTDSVLQYDMSTPFDLNTMSYSGLSFSVSDAITDSNFWSLTGTADVLLVVNYTNEVLYKYG